MKLLAALLFMIALSVPVYSQVEGITVSSPVAGSSYSPISINATASKCDNKTVTALGYSLDSSANTTIVNGTKITGDIPAALGSHVVHIKSWGSGTSCVDNITVNVVAAPSEPTIPLSATTSSSLQEFAWQMQHDPGTTGTSSGTTALVTTPSLTGHSRQFTATYTDSAGELFHISFPNNPTATNFLYDTKLYLTSSNTLANVEMDLNQVLPNGQTVIYGFQCDGWSNTWDYTANTGTAAQPVDKWVHSTQYCNPRSWSLNTWHHIQISYSRNSTGDVTYNSVWVDGTEQKIDATVFSSFSLGWGSVLLANFQLDGINTGSTTVYMDDLAIYSW